MSHTIKEFRSIKELVEKLLETEPNTRNDDKLLTYRVFEEISRAHGEGIFISFKLWNTLPAFETVKRCRAYIQNNEGRFLPTDPKALRLRKRRQKTIGKLMAEGTF